MALALACELIFAARTCAAAEGCLVFPSSTNAFQLRLYANASPDAEHLFNTFDLDAYGETLLKSPGNATLEKRIRQVSTNTSLHNILVNGGGPNLAATNNLTAIERSAGPEWSYVLLDATAAYRDRVKQFTRGILFVEPDLFVIYDHLVGTEPLSFEMILHPPDATRLDPDWHDLRLDLPKASMTVHAPGRRRDLRAWEKVESEVDTMVPGTVTMRLSPTNRLNELSVLTIFAARPAGEKRDYVFKLLESSRAIGAQIQRDGLPTVVAFNTVPGATNSSLAGFEFNGPAGVYVFKPGKPKR